MVNGKLADKVINYGTGLMAVWFLSIKSVFACQNVICNSGIESSLCAVEQNIKNAQWYLSYSLIIFIAVTIFCLARRGEGSLIAIVCFACTVLPPMWRYLSVDGGCDRFITEIAQWLFYLSCSLLLYQAALWLFALSKSKIKLS